MAQAGIYAPGAVIDADVVVRVGGIVREHVSMDWSGDTTGGLPDQLVSAGSGMRSRTGSILWAPDASVTADPPHPLRRTGGWPPREGDEVVIDATVDTGQGPYSFRRFTGRLGRTTGSLTDGTLTSEITDTLGDSLQENCSIPPAILGSYTKSQQIAYRAMEQAGLGVLPPPDQWTVGHIGGQGGVDPTVGTIEPGMTGSGSGDPYGVTATTGLRLVPTTTVRASGESVLVMGRASTNWDSVLRASLTNGTAVTLTHRKDTRKLSLFVPGVGLVWEGTSLDDSPLPVMAVQFFPSYVRVYTSATTFVNTSSWSIPSGVGVRWIEGTYLIGRAIRVLPSTASGHLTVASRPRLPTGWQPSALELGFLPASRAIENVPARSVVDAWGEATLAAVWMDEMGKPWAVARDRLLTRPVSRTLYVEERVLAGSWSVGDDQVRSAVLVKGQQSALQRTGRSGAYFLAYQEQSNRAFDQAPTAPIERFVDVPPEQEWGPLDTAPEYFGDMHSVNAGLAGTWTGAVVASNASGDQPETWAQGDGVTTATVIERLGQRAMKLTETISGVPAGKTLYMKTPNLQTLIHPAMRGVAMPIIRAEWVTTWTDYTVTGATKGPAWAPPFEHDVSWFLMPENAQRFADALAAEVTQAMPTLGGVSVLWDPRRQIGDVETWIATDSTGAESWRADVLVSGYGENWDGSVPSQSVDVRVISWTDPIEGETYGDLAAAYATYGDMTGTYQQTFDALPEAL